MEDPGPLARHERLKTDSGRKELDPAVERKDARRDGRVAFRSGNAGKVWATSTRLTHSYHISNQFVRRFVTTSADAR